MTGVQTCALPIYDEVDPAMVHNPLMLEMEENNKWKKTKKTIISNGNNLDPSGLELEDPSTTRSEHYKNNRRMETTVRTITRGNKEKSFERSSSKSKWNEINDNENNSDQNIGGGSQLSSKNSSGELSSAKISGRARADTPKTLQPLARSSSHSRFE